MKVCIIGSGGREHALAWKAAQSPDVERVFVIPGNGGTAMEEKLENVPLSISDFPALIEFCQQQAVALTIVGPEAPLVAGIVDAFQDAGLPCFGPSRGAAQLEGSKTFSKDFLKRHQIPTADYASFTQADAAITYIKEKGTPIVIKADGLAAGKGVVLAHTEAEAVSAVQSMLGDGQFGEAGRTIVVEEFLTGEEASFIVMADGENVLPFATSQDHKARDDGDEGPNTGGMGAYSPAPVVSDHIHQRVMQEVIYPTIKGMKQEGYSYTGFLYAGLMIDEHGTPKVLEFNCRFGDPETQPIMMRMHSDLVALCLSAVKGELKGCSIEWDSRCSLGVVMAAGGYPAEYKTGDEITGIPPEDADQKVFHAGTKLVEGKLLTAGGRVLCSVALGNTVAQAQAKAYEIVKQIKWNNVYYRNDIGYRAVQREKSNQ